MPGAYWLGAERFWVSTMGQTQTSFLQRRERERGRERVLCLPCLCRAFLFCFVFLLLLLAGEPGRVGCKPCPWNLPSQLGPKMSKTPDKERRERQGGMLPAGLQEADTHRGVKQTRSRTLPLPSRAVRREAGARPRRKRSAGLGMRSESLLGTPRQVLGSVLTLSCALALFTMQHLHINLVLYSHTISAAPPGPNVRIWW